MAGMKAQLIDLAGTLESFVESTFQNLPISRSQIDEMCKKMANVGLEYPVGSDLTIPIASARVTAAFLRNFIKTLPDDE